MSGSTEGQDTTTEVAKGTTAVKTSGEQTGTTNTSGTQTGTTSGTSTTEATIPDWLRGLMQQSATTAGEGLQGYEDAVNAFRLDPTAMGALTDTAAGKYLYGGEAQNAFTDAAQRAAMPGILSTFGGSGRGTGGLAQTAIGQAGIDAYAGMYDEERNRMQAAAQAIPGLQMLPFELQRSLISAAQANPSAFSSLFGSAGTSTGTTNVTSQGTTTTAEKSAGTSTGKTSGETKTTTPTHEDPDWYKYVDIATALAGLAAAPATGGTSAAAAAGGKSTLSSLLGLFR